MQAPPWVQCSTAPLLTLTCLSLMLQLEIEGALNTWLFSFLKQLLGSPEGVPLDVAVWLVFNWLIKSHLTDA